MQGVFSLWGKVGRTLLIIVTKNIAHIIERSIACCEKWTRNKMLPFEKSARLSYLYILKEVTL